MPETEQHFGFGMPFQPVFWEEYHLHFGVYSAEGFDQICQILRQEVVAKRKSNVVITRIVDDKGTFPLEEAELVHAAPGEEVAEVEVAIALRVVMQAALDERRQVRCQQLQVKRCFIQVHNHFFV